MRSRALITILSAAVVATALASCGGDGGDKRRTIQIVQTDDACTPAAIEVTAGEKLTLEIKNDGKKDHEVEGIDGTKLEELLVPAGRVRSISYTVPKSGDTRKVKCYIPGGSATIIELHVTGASGAAAPDGGGETKSRVTNKSARDTVRVRLTDYRIEPSKPAAAAGPVKFIADNASPSEVHELAVLRVLEGGAFDNTGEIEDVAPGATGEVTLDLPPGRYLLACVIVPGEAGSKVDHFAQGMRAEFSVQ